MTLIWKRAGFWQAAFLLLVAAWMVDPVAWRVRFRFPSVTVSDRHDYRWFLPGFLHSRVHPTVDLFDGTYLRVELSNQTVDLNQLRDVPFFLLILNHCRVTDLSPIDAMPLGRRCIMFKDCDLSATSVAGRLSDPRRATYSINAP
jgi:hypothetical protein